ncbi:MAG: hypothetical protein V1691_00890 [Chloroflexota bacterium]
MKLYNSYIIMVAVLFLLTTIVLIAIGQESLGVFYTIYIIEALALTELYMYFNSKARHSLALVSSILFGGFILILCLQVFRILA